MPNPQTHKIILKDRVEMDADNHGSYLKIYAMGGETYRIPDKRNSLWDVFKNANRLEPILATFETYKNNEYIVNAKPILDQILNNAVKNFGMKITDAFNEERNRSQSISYAKDLVVANIITLSDMYNEASRIYNFIKGA